MPGSLKVITDAFKIKPIHPSQWHLFKIKLDSKYITFSCWSSSAIFNLVSEGLGWILLNNIKLPSVLHLLDDFLLTDPPHDESDYSLSELKSAFTHLDVPLSGEKKLLFPQ